MVGGSSPVGRQATADDVPAIAARLASAFGEDPAVGSVGVPGARAARTGSMRADGLLGAGSRARAMGADDKEGRVGRGLAATWRARARGRGGGRVRGARRRAVRHPCRGARQTVRALRGAPPRGAALLHEPVGTHRDHAGLGIGSTLMRECLRDIDAACMPSYLESTNSAHLPRYEALGFERCSELRPPGGRWSRRCGARPAVSRRRAARRAADARLRARLAQPACLAWA
jgi:GNAT superfamily N-acetyltransferase